MGIKPKILAFSGSLRKGSFNKKLVKIALEGAKQPGVEVTYLDLADYPLPLYDGDLEQSQGLPANVKALKKIFLAHQGFLIASPEYNSSLPGTFKNMIDWVSRPSADEPEYLAPFKGKAAAIMSASPSHLGGLRGLVHLRAMLENIFIHVLPEQVWVAYADKAFTAEGQLKDPKEQHKAIQQGKNLVDFVLKLHARLPEVSEL
ncbi:NAD(P)H-dependent oxidoreductase [Parachlamydia sp. AcF125]|uniref:NADPH-dependent FMN reductase n=1 Tax=Parachlamydia sp. AcF125 TaxID=2795736 RepID=UPI001BCA219F|nr:NAD(P)H-dependent oxidoreductase [Parachlamydia sp. AcF125]MBS4169036.1 NAD(P)H-dependent FMN reductase [Parachlamydia sp. AcF125]